MRVNFLLQYVVTELAAIAADPLQSAALRDQAHTLLLRHAQQNPAYVTFCLSVNCCTRGGWRMMVCVCKETSPSVFMDCVCFLDGREGPVVASHYLHCLSSSDEAVVQCALPHAADYVLLSAGTPLIPPVNDHHPSVPDKQHYVLLCMCVWTQIMRRRC